jgi:hypothetical protein
MSIPALLGNPLTAIGTTGSDPLTAMSLAIKFQTRDLANLAKDPIIIRDIKNFQGALSKAKTTDDLLKNPAARSYLFAAFGMSDQADAYGIAKKVFSEDPTKPKALVAKLSDKRWKAIATTLRLDQGLTNIKASTVQKTISNAFIKSIWLDKQDAATPGMSDALTFKERAASTSSNIYSVLGDAVVRRVTMAVAGLPDTIAILPIESQASMLQSKIKLADLKDSKKVDLIAKRYLVLQPAAPVGGNGSASDNQTVKLMQGISGTYGGSVLNLLT